MKNEIEIPEGYEAKIEGNKVVIVPKESEDERIKNLIYCIVRDRSDVGKLLKANGCPVKKALSWIAKQEERKPVQTPQWMIDFLNEHRRIFGCPMDYDEHKEADGKLLCIKEWLEGNPNIEQKPVEWSEEDEQFLLVCKNALQKYQSSDKWDAAIIYNWLEKRLKSLRPQPHWKPSEERMTVLTKAIEGTVIF